MNIRVALLTREYPPHVYGGGGVHVEYLARELAEFTDLTVHAWGEYRHGAVGHQAWQRLSGDAPHLAALRAVSVDLSMAAAVADSEVVHSHTWYANLAGHLAKLVYGVPHVATVHSLEPMRPWKAEQLGGGYALSGWCERVALEGADAIIAVSDAMRRDILACYPAVDPDRVSVVYNGVDTCEYRPDSGTDVLARHGVDPGRPIVVFVGRTTRQKGVLHLLDAAHGIDPDAQLVLCTGDADSMLIAARVEQQVRRLQAARGNVVWLNQMLPKREVIQLLSHATAFVCPSVYEPFGIVNLEAMTCETAVVATATGGIVEVVQDGITGLLVPYQPASSTALEPRDAAAFSTAIAERVNALLADPQRAAAMGRAGREHAQAGFTWPAIARQTAEVYAAVRRPAR